MAQCSLLLHALLVPLYEHNEIEYTPAKFGSCCNCLACLCDEVPIVPCIWQNCLLILGRWLHHCEKLDEKLCRELLFFCWWGLWLPIGIAKKSDDKRTVKNIKILQNKYLSWLQTVSICCALDRATTVSILIIMHTVGIKLSDSSSLHKLSIVYG